MFQPKVSIIIPVYNGSNFLKEAIDSALSQSYANIEVLVINDGSNDSGATELIAMSYGNSIRYFTKPNCGVSSALNFGIKKMTGDYFSWLSHDDVYKPEKVQRQIEYLLQNGMYDTILYGSYELINNRSKIISIIDFSKLYPNSKLNIPLFPVFRGLANGCTMLIHKSHFERVGMFDEGLRTTQDYELWFRMFRGARVGCCPGIYLKSRVHPTQTGRTAENHTEDCNSLWISMLNEVTNEEMCRIEGTPYHFYMRTADYLRRHSLYTNAAKHADVLALKEIEKHDGQVPFEVMEEFSPYSMASGGPIDMLRRLLFNMKYEGVKNTILKVIRKVK